jgi:hypothetical protein
LILEEVIITRNDWTATNDEREMARVMSVMQIIDPHIHRCCAISFNVLFSSSLPSFPGDFHGSAQLLTSLELRCVEDDGGAPSDVGETSFSTIHHEPLQCPNLRTLSIDGRNYFNACQRNVNWTKIFPVLSTLSISHFTPVAIRSESFASSDLVLSIVPFQNYLTTLCIDDVHLDESPTPILDDDGELDFDDLCELEMLTLKNMHNTKQILDFFGGSPNLHIARCRLHPDYTVYHVLSLKEIDKSENLVAFLRTCHTEKLIVDDCPGFGDAVLHAMTIPDPGAQAVPWTLPYCAQSVQDLSILNCPDFSISALKQLVETTRINMPYGLTLPPIHAVQLSGRVPEVSSENREWFKGRLSEFSYNPIQ